MDQRPVEQGVAGDTWVSCVLVGDLYSSGERVLKDANRARAFYVRACSAGLTSACRKAQLVR